MLPLTSWIKKRLARLRFPTLALISAVLFLVNLFLPDPLPFIDEILLLCTTVLLGNLKNNKRKSAKDDHTSRTTSHHAGNTREDEP